MGGRSGSRVEKSSEEELEELLFRHERHRRLRLPGAQIGLGAMMMMAVGPLSIRQHNARLASTTVLRTTITKLSIAVE